MKDAWGRKRGNSIIKIIWSVKFYTALRLIYTLLSPMNDGLSRVVQIPTF